MNKLIPFFSVLFLFSCGADHPFKRGLPAPSKTTDNPPAKPPETGSPKEAPKNTESPPPVPNGKQVFIKKVYPYMQAKCFECHKGMGEPFDLTGDAEKDYLSSLKKITPKDPEKSLMFIKVQNKGAGHDGGEIWTSGMDELLMLKEWILNEI